MAKLPPYRGGPLHDPGPPRVILDKRMPSGEIALVSTDAAGRFVDGVVAKLEKGEDYPSKVLKEILMTMPFDSTGKMTPEEVEKALAPDEAVAVTLDENGEPKIRKASPLEKGLAEGVRIVHEQRVELEELKAKLRAAETAAAGAQRDLAMERNRRELLESTLGAERQKLAKANSELARLRGVR